MKAATAINFVATWLLVATVAALLVLVCEVLSLILALDAGISAANASGGSIFDNVTSRLFATTVIRRDPKLEGLDAHWDIAEQLMGWVTRTLGTRPITDFVTEWPFVYPQERKKNPNTALLPLCGVIGAVNGMLGRQTRRVMWSPKEWKGTMDGEVFIRTRIIPVLDAHELALLNAVLPAGLRHNAADSVGLGLKYLGRLDHARVIHNAVRAGR